MRFNSPTGKAILSLVREGDYAHPGEESAIDLLFSSVSKDPDRRVLDLGCGRGGTAGYVQRHGWGRVTGVDIDGETLKFASYHYPNVTFIAEDVARIGQHWQSEFDLVYLFNSFYAFPDQVAALHQIRQVARPGATLAIFEYTDRGGTFREHARSENSFWTPVNLSTFPADLTGAGWDFVGAEDITSRYLKWYRELVARIVAKRADIVGDFGQEWYDLAYSTYGELLSLIERGIVGGAIIWAKGI